MTERAKTVNELPHSTYFAHTVRRAYSVAARRGSAVVGLEHFLYALLDDPEALALMEGCDADIASIRVELGSAIERNTPRDLLGSDETPQAGKGLRHVLQVSQKGARESGRSEVDGAIALAALVGQSDAPVARLLNKHGLSFGKALGWIDAQNGRGPSAVAARATQARQPRAPGPQPATTQQTARPMPQPAPERAVPAKRDAPPRPRSVKGPEPTLEDMLSTIRDVMDDEEEAPPPREKPRPPARKPAQQPAHSEASPQTAKRAPAPAETRQRSEPNGAVGQQPKRRRAAKAGSEAQAPSVLGKLVERIPRQMREGQREHIEVRIAREATEELVSGVQGRGAAHVHSVAVTRAMSLYLRAPDGGFLIEPLMPETQWVFDRPSFLESEPFGRWEWIVLPTQRGSRKLQLVAAARSVDDNGMIGDVALPEQVIEVRVRINWARTLRKAALWAALAIAGGVLAEVGSRFLPGLLG